MKNKIIIANWKMNNSFDEAETWLTDFNKKIADYNNASDLPTLVVCPPAILIDYLDELLMDKELQELSDKHDNIDDFSEEETENLIAGIRKVHLGGQDCHYELKGAYTGGISAKMLKDCGSEYVILGHSERRKCGGEKDEVIAKKIKIAVENKLIPILCVGENKEIRENKTYKDFIISQLDGALKSNNDLQKLIIAYEPIWSIGTGIIPQISEITEIASLINDYLSKNTKIKQYHIIYGGSVNKSNAAEIKQVNNIDGLLVGGASLKADEFFTIATV